jgi:signal transduction histidine kinase
MRGHVFRGRIGRRLVLTFVAFVMAAVGVTGWVLYRLTMSSLEREMSLRLVGVAQLVSEGIDGEAATRLQPGYEGGRLHSRIRARLRRIRDTVGARRITVFDRTGRSLADTEAGVPIGREYFRLRIDRAETDTALRGEASHSVRFRGEDGREYKSGYAPVWFGDEVVAGVRVDIGAGFLDTIQAFGRSILILGAVGMLLTVLVGMVLARTLTRPISRLVDAAWQIGRGNLGHPVESPSRDELGYLGAAMEDMRHRIVRRDEQLRQMLAGVAHEIRNPLGGIEIYAGLIADDLAENDPRKSHIQKVTREVRNLNRVISEFMDFARPAALAPSRVEVAEAAGDVAFLLAPEMEGSGVACRLDVPDRLAVRADPDQLRRMLTNLVKNAAQAMPSGGTVTVSAREAGDEVEVTVADTGAGIEPDAIDRVFEPFFTTREKGSGLGLAVVHQVAEAHGGRVWVSSTREEGTTFRVALPGAE